MKLYSTRDMNTTTNSKDAIIKGLSDDGGLFCPRYEDIAKNKFDIKDLISLGYKNLAKKVFQIMLSDFSEKELEVCIDNAYNDKNFEGFGEIIAPTSKIGDNFLLELYHGPTSAFKDVALTILPQFLSVAYKSKNENKKVYILTATSGDTGKAALSGFKDVENVFITVFYPTDGVSEIQKKQMATSEGENVSVVALDGDFDDCQRLVKEIYTDDNIKKICDEYSTVLSSANSINIGRLVPQIVYYIYSYIELVNKKLINIYDKVNFVVPTGNFGDILAGYIAKILGLPVDKFICASNDNNVLTDFINTGVYDKNRRLYKTISPSMDILVSSNLERLLFLLSDDSSYIKSLMTELNEKGRYKISDALLSKIKENFVGYYATEDECKNSIKEAFDKDKRLIDTHTAVAYATLKKYQNIAKKEIPTIILSTASPYKFSRAVLDTICGENNESLDDYSLIDKLYSVSNEPVPKNLSALKEKKVRFDTVLSFADCKNYVINKIKEI